MSIRAYIRQLFCHHYDAVIARSADNRAVLSKCWKCGRLIVFEKFQNILYRISEETFLAERDTWIGVTPCIRKANEEPANLVLFEPTAMTHADEDGCRYDADFLWENSTRLRELPPLPPYLKVDNIETGRIHSQRFEPITKDAIGEPTRVMPGSASDGFHTFDELYRHRGTLFALICADHQEIAWKSKLHHDGTMFPGMFLCCIDTPYGQASYHMDINPFWDMIKVKELPKAPEWDGHTPDMALNRIAAMAMDRFVPLANGVVED